MLLVIESKSPSSDANSLPIPKALFIVLVKLKYDFNVIWVNMKNQN